MALKNSRQSAKSKGKTQVRCISFTCVFCPLCYPVTPCPTSRHTRPHPPLNPTPKIWHECTNQLLCGWSCAFSSCFRTSPHMTVAVRFDNAEHLPLSPLAMNKRGDFSPPFICNVTSVQSLVVTELGKMVDPTVCENPWGFSWEQGTLSWQDAPKKDQLPLTVPIVRFLYCAAWRLSGNAHLVELGLKGQLGPMDLILPASHTHEGTHREAIQKEAQIQKRLLCGVPVQMARGCRCNDTQRSMMRGEETE